MATAAPPEIEPEAAALAGPLGRPTARITVRQFLRMGRAGVFPDHHRGELLGGMIVARVTKHPPHDFCVGQLGMLLNRLPIRPMFAREEKAVILGRHWRPEPDLSVVHGPPRRFANRTPRATDIAMLIEVAESTYAADRGRKWRRYAAARIDPYWIVNLPARRLKVRAAAGAEVPACWVVDLAARRVEVHADPAGKGRQAAYRSVVAFEADSAVPVTIEGAERGRIAVADILP